MAPLDLVLALACIRPFRFQWCLDIVVDPLSRCLRHSYIGFVITISWLLLLFSPRY